MSRFRLTAALKALGMVAILPLIVFISGVSLETPRMNSRCHDLGMFAIVLGAIALGLAAASVWVNIPKMVLDSSLVATVSFIFPMVGLEAHRTYTELYTEIINAAKQS